MNYFVSTVTGLLGAQNIQYITPIAFPLQQQLPERTSMLRDIYIACVVYIYATIKFTVFKT
jgi:hypothetical protein